jgi:glycine betaine/proline transport system substrate-binding protein
MWVNVPENIPTVGQKAYKDKMTMSGVKGAVSDPIKMGLPANDIAVVASKGFLSENPAAARLFEVMSVPLEDIAAQNNRMFKGEDSPQDIESHVDEWIQANRDTWDGWLNEAVAAAQ